MILLILLLSLVVAACDAKVSNVVSDASANKASSSVTPVPSVQTVTIASADGVQLVGSLLEASKPNSPAVLLLHQWQSDRHSYDEFADRMRGKGLIMLAIDGRGFGESTKKADGTNVTARRTDADVQAMLGDVGAAIEFLKSAKNVDPKRIAIVGASYGSSLAIIYAADHPEISAVALLSPGLNYFGNMPTRPAVEKYGDRDLFIVAAKGDAESAKAVDGLMLGHPKHGFMVLPTGTYHGTDLFKYRDKTDGPAVVEDALESFLTTRLGPDK